MKMSIVQRALLSIYTLIIILISIAVLGISIAVGINVIPLSEVNATLRAIQLDWRFFLISAVVSILFLIISFKLLFTRTGSKAAASTLIKHTNLGVIRVSVHALEIMAQKAVRSFEEIKDVKINILSEEDGIKVRLKIIMMPEVVLPDLSVSIQEKVKEYIETYSGIVVKDVYIYVDNLSTPQQQPKVQ